MNSTSCKCGRIRGELNKTNWTRHLESCGKKRKLHSTSITSFFKLPVKTSSTTTLPLPTRRTEQINDNTLNADFDPAMLCEIEQNNGNTLNTDFDPAMPCEIEQINDNTLNTDFDPAMPCEIEKINDNADIDPAKVCAIEDNVITSNQQLNVLDNSNTYKAKDTSSEDNVITSNQQLNVLDNSNTYEAKDTSSEDNVITSNQQLNVLDNSNTYEAKDTSSDLVVGTVGLSFHNEQAELGVLFSNKQHQFVDTINNNDPIHFARMNHITPEQKNFILKLGPCQPLPEHIPGKSFPIDNNGRHFSHLWYNRFLPDGSKVLRDWLSYSISENKIFCLHCMLYGVNTHSVSAKSWTNIGFSTWINGVSRINKHELSSEHVTATIKVKIKNHCVPLLPSMEYQKKIQIATNRQIISELIDIILFLARHNLSFRGHNEQWSNPLSRGNFKDLVILMSKNSVSLSEHITKLKSRGRQELSFISWERQNQLIECIAKDISTTIQYQVKNTRFFSIAIDSTFDASRKEQVSFIIRYTCLKSGNVLERLIAMRESPNTCGGDLFSLFKNIMEGEGYVWLTDLVGQSYDGASNMRGAYKGLQALIKEENKHATFVWCHAHRLNLIVKQIVSSNSNSADLFGNLETLYSFVWCAKKRVAIFRQFQTTDSSKSHQPLALKRVCTTRWSSRSAALDTVLKTHKCIINTLTTIQAQEGPSDPKVSATCSGLIQYFTSFRFLITAFVFKKIFSILEPVNKKLQTRDMDLLAATNLLDNAKSKIRELNRRENNSFSEVIKDAEQFSVKSSIDFSSLPVPRYKRIPKKSGELVNDNPINDPIKKIKIECYYGALDLIQTELNDRFDDESSGLLKDLSLLSRKRILEVRLLPNSLPKDAFKQVVELYGEFLEHDALIRNYMDFCQNYLELENTVTLPEYIHKTPNQGSDESEKFFDDFDQDKSDNEDEASTSDKTNIENSGSMNKLFQLCCVLQLKTVFPNLYTLLQIAVTLPVSSCSVERSFSKLKLVKTKLRSTMTEDRLENLMIITCEQDCEPNTERVIKYFSTKSTLLSKSLTLI